MINYQSDFYSWTQEQAALLRSGRLQELDIENLIEEIETMGRSEKRELESRLAVLLVHLLKWRYQPIRRGRSWQLMIDEQRLQFSKMLSGNPGLKSQLEQLINEAYALAIIRSSKETGLEKHVFPESCPWDVAQILDDGFYPN
ncbi:MAG: DUF29 domain-containing protein [Methylococcaceae bacterium]|nr:DUF29 domain-containing protein [Methylococcaceae bacterium]